MSSLLLKQLIKKPVRVLLALPGLLLIMSGCMTKALIRDAGEPKSYREHFSHIETAGLAEDGQLLVCLSGTLAGETQISRYSLRVPPEQQAPAARGTALYTLDRSVIGRACPAEPEVVLTEIPVDSRTLQQSLPETVKLKNLHLPAGEPGALYLMSGRYLVLVCRPQSTDAQNRAIIYSLTPRRFKGGTYKLAAVPFTLVGDAVVSVVYFFIKFWKVVLL